MLQRQEVRWQKQKITTEISEIKVLRKIAERPYKIRKEMGILEKYVKWIKLETG